MDQIQKSLQELLAATERLLDVPEIQTVTAVELKPLRACVATTKRKLAIDANRKDRKELLA